MFKKENKRNSQITKLITIFLLVLSTIVYLKEDNIVLSLGIIIGVFFMQALSMIMENQEDILTELKNKH